MHADGVEVALAAGLIDALEEVVVVAGQPAEHDLRRGIGRLDGRVGGLQQARIGRGFGSRRPTTAARPPRSRFHRPPLSLPSARRGSAGWWRSRRGCSAGRSAAGEPLSQEGVPTKSRITWVPFGSESRAAGRTWPSQKPNARLRDGSRIGPRREHAHPVRAQRRGLGDARRFEACSGSRPLRRAVRASASAPSRHTRRPPGGAARIASREQAPRRTRRLRHGPTHRPIADSPDAQARGWPNA